MEAEKGTPVNYEHHSDTCSAFLRPKLGKQYEASCVSFERVLVENKLHGLSPALSEAIQSISRWELVQAALPHVLHCTAILLSNRNKLGKGEEEYSSMFPVITSINITFAMHVVQSFERVLVENKLHGLSPALSEAIQSISRWELVQAALPHVLHCTAILLSNRNKLGHQDKLGVAETKLLHTLHWMLLDAAQECNHEAGVRGGRGSSWSGSSSAFIHQLENQGSPGQPLNGSTPEDDEHSKQKLFHKSMATVELFVFLFAPLIHRIKESDLTFRLASGLVIWQPMWEQKQPDVPAFTALIKPVRNIVTGASVQSCRRGNSLEGGGPSQASKDKGVFQNKAPTAAPPAQRSRYGTYFDVAVLRCLLQPHWSEEGTHWALLYCLQRLRQILEEKPERPPEPLLTQLPRPRSSSMVAAAPSLVNTHKTQDMTSKCNEEKSLSTETFSKVSLTNLRRQAVPDLSSDLGLNIFKKFKSRKEERERKGSIPFHHPGKRRQRRMGVPFLLHEDHLDVSPTRSTFSFGSFSGIGDERRGLEKGGWQTAILGKFTRRGSSDTTADVDSLSARQSHSHHTLMTDAHDQPNSHGENTVKEVRSQISTITVATFNTTVASFNVGYADFFTEHMKKLCNPVPIPEMPIEPLACSNLPRSLTDSCINYSCLEDAESIEGTNNFILKNGMLDLAVILRAVYVVLTHDISSRICDVTLNIIECLLQLGVVPSMGKKVSKVEEKENEETRLKDGTNQRTGGTNMGQDDSVPQSSHRLALTMLIKIVKSLGCAYGCGEGHRGLSGDRLRMQAQNCLTRLYKLDKLQFRQTVRDYVNKDSLNNVVDFLHAFLGFCMEPITDNKAGFGNNFTTGDSKSVAQNMEAVVVGCMFKSLITRCASTTHELHSPENLGLYCDIRQLVQFIKESHGNVFRRVALSALLDSTEKVTSVKKTEEKDETKLPGNRRSDAGNTNDKGQPSSAADECRSYISSRPPQTPEHEEQIPGALLGRKDFWRKMFKSQSAASDTSSQSEQDTSECTTAHSGTTTERRSRSRSRSRRISLRKKLKLPIDGVEDLLDISSVDRLSFIRQSSKVKFTSAVKLSEGGAMEYGRDDEENFFKRLGKWRSGRRNPSKLHHAEEKDVRFCSGLSRIVSWSSPAQTYVRDIYPFRRSVSPQLNLVHMLPDKGQELIQKQVFSRKLEEVGRVLFLISLTQNMPAVHKQSHVSLLQEDLLRLPSFPRNAVDAEFSLFSDPQGKELFGLDTLHKVLWIKLLEEMFLGMPSEYPWGDEIMLFLNVFNGVLILHPEDSALLRQYTATVINTAVHFNHLFSLSGYQWILPTMLQAYADYESNPLLRQAIEFSCRQFYILHRKPFVLQLFASVAPLLEFTTCTSSGLSKGVSAQCLFDLLVSLEGDSLDTLDALELVKAEKPLRSLDFCYGNEDLNFTISKAIKLCVTVVAYAPESFRSLHMLMVLEALVPCFLQKLKKETIALETASAARDEITAIATLATSLQALLYSVEALTRPMTAPQMSRCEQGHKGATTANHTVPGGTDTRDNLHLLEEGQGLPREELDERIAREEFRRPRESLLNICTEFYKHCGPRLKILQNMTGEPRVTTLELLDIKSHMRLAEIAHSLLKLAPYDTLTMESRGLRRYIMEMLPITDWTTEAVRPALILILKRLDRMFNKIHKMPTLRRQVEWEAASSLIEGICLTLQRQPIISFLPHLRSLINVCVNLVMGVVGPSSVADGLPLLHLSPYLSPPLPFSTAVVRLVALQIQALKDDFPLSHVISPFTNQERREGMLLNLLIPFVLTVGSGSKDSPHLEQPEVFLLLQTVINILLPPRIISTSRSKNFMMESSPAHCSTPGDTGKDLRREGLAESTSQAAYLALKVVLVCFERQLGNQWYQLSLQVKEMALRKVGGLALWDFIDFIVRTRIPIFILLRPFIQCKLLTQPAESQEEITARHHIADQLERRFIPRPLCKSSLIAEFNNELKILKEAVHSGAAYQGKTSISTVGTSTSAYRLSLATMSRSNTGTGTVWQQDSQPSHRASQDTLSRTDEDDEEIPWEY
ncbi:Protein unc-80-like [Acipenser ruthenus]|uniref:Protein unc-80-like n=1 Tax=Acipenser ruthenus TaxID=7906 RepID=A0A444UG65_ACIRT|nr:Protein unc-80-like [Acipenser ruthenus]